jgi:hypothetical protein
VNVASFSRFHRHQGIAPAVGVEVVDQETRSIWTETNETVVLHRPSVSCMPILTRVGHVLYSIATSLICTDRLINFKLASAEGGFEEAP